MKTAIEIEKNITAIVKAMQNLSELYDHFGEARTIIDTGFPFHVSLDEIMIECLTWGKT